MTYKGLRKMEDYELEIEIDNFEIENEFYDAYIRYYTDMVDDYPLVYVTHCELMLVSGIWVTVHQEYFPMIERPLRDYLINEAENDYP
jgi:hypothetical protein